MRAAVVEGMSTSERLEQARLSQSTLQMPAIARSTPRSDTRPSALTRAGPEDADGRPHGTLPRTPGPPPRVNQHPRCRPPQCPGRVLPPPWLQRGAGDLARPEFEFANHGDELGGDARVDGALEGEHQGRGLRVGMRGGPWGGNRQLNRGEERVGEYIWLSWLSCHGIASLRCFPATHVRQGHPAVLPKLRQGAPLLDVDLRLFAVEIYQEPLLHLRGRQEAHGEGTRRHGA